MNNSLTNFSRKLKIPFATSKNLLGQDIIKYIFIHGALIS